MQKLREFLSTPSTQLGRAGRFAAFQIKLWSHCTRLLRNNRAGQQAAALSYRTIFGIIPLAIVMLLVFQLFPKYSDIGQKVRNLIYDELGLSSLKYDTGDIEQGDEGKIPMKEHLDKTVANFFRGIDSSKVALVSLPLVIWAALSLLSTIEKAFNNIWHVAKGRNFLQRIINYWALLTLGPILLGVGVYIATTNATFTKLEDIESDIAPALLSYLVSVVAFFLLYFVLPNTKVNARAAIWGAAVAALVWAFAKWVFGIYVTKFIPYSQVYGMLGLIPLSVFWIYVTWLIVLFGLQLTFTTQHLRSLDAAEISSAAKSEEFFIANDITAINIVREIAAAFENNQAPVETEVISSKLEIPPEFTEKILDSFVDSGIIARTAEPVMGYLPAKDPANVPLSEISEALAKVSFAQSVTARPDNLQQITESGKNALAQYNIKQILGIEKRPGNSENGDSAQ